VEAFCCSSIDVDDDDDNDDGMVENGVELEDEMKSC
jgi:hypothetical protein